MDGVRGNDDGGGGEVLRGDFSSTGSEETAVPEAGAGDSSDWREGRMLCGTCWVGENVTSWSTVTSSDNWKATKPDTEEPSSIIDDAKAEKGGGVVTPSLVILYIQQLRYISTYIIAPTWAEMRADR